jgi:hypothetical protein
VQLTAFAMQAEFGDYDPAVHSSRYFHLYDFFPEATVVNMTAAVGSQPRCTCPCPDLTSSSHTHTHARENFTRSWNEKCLDNTRNSKACRRSAQKRSTSSLPRSV